jgi:hypothetical protein
MRKCIVVCAAMCASACATPAQRVATQLTKAGLDPVRARCIGDRLDRDLSIAQLKQLGEAAHSLKPSGSQAGRVTVTDLVRLTREIQDPAVPIAVARAAMTCA